ncbi:MAG: tripartite tricarboxylate transporter TctB family protein [bacterium]
MKRANQIAAVLILLLSLYICITGIGLGFLDRNVPGPGFTPFWIGLLLGVFGLGVLWESRNLTGESLFTPRVLKVWLVLTLLGMATIAASYVLGLLISLALLAGCTIRYLGGTWKQTAITTIAVGISFYFLFVKFLMVWFPKGFLGI